MHPNLGVCSAMFALFFSLTSVARAKPVEVTRPTKPRAFFGASAGFLAHGPVDRPPASFNGTWTLSVPDYNVGFAPELEIWGADVGSAVVVYSDTFALPHTKLIAVPWGDVIHGALDLPGVYVVLNMMTWVDEDHIAGRVDVSTDDGVVVYQGVLTRTQRSSRFVTEPIVAAFNGTPFTVTDDNGNPVYLVRVPGSPEALRLTHIKVQEALLAISMKASDGTYYSIEAETANEVWVPYQDSEGYSDWASAKRNVEIFRSPDGKILSRSWQSQPGERGVPRSMSMDFFFP